MTEKYRNTPKGRIAPNGYRLCDPLPEGQILVDNEKKQWVIGKTIGVGGFGEIYLIHEKDSPSKEFVMKLDNINGPLFVEVNFVLRACQKNTINAFMEKRKLSFLGIPRFIASGTHQSPNGGYRFLIMERLGEELQKVLETKRLSIPVTCKIACRIIDCLEYIHDQGYIHADIKAQNILRSVVFKTETAKRSKKRPSEDRIEDDDNYYLIDYGLVERYTYQGVHKPYEPDRRKANNGTCEFRSRDAHIGVISRRSDIESLGFNLILWFYGRHPWGNLLKDADKVHEKKQWAMKNINQFLKESFNDKPMEEEDSLESKSSKTPIKPKTKALPKKNIPININPPKGLSNFFEEINSLSHDDRPNYTKYKKILEDIGKLNPTTNFLNGTPKKARLSDEPSKVIAPDVKSNKKMTRTTKLEQTKKSLINSFNMNGELTESDNSDLEDCVDSKTKSSRLKTTRSNKTKLAKSNKEIETPSSGRTLRNRLKTEDVNDISLNEMRKSPKCSNNTNTPRNHPRYSTVLLAITPTDDDEPLFGAFEPEDSIKDDRILSKNNSQNKKSKMNSKNVNDENAGIDRPLNTCRIYINNRRCRPMQSYDDDDLNGIIDHSAPPSTLSSSNESLSSEYLPNGKLTASASSKKTKTSVAKRKPNGLISSSVNSSCSKSSSKKNGKNSNKAIGVKSTTVASTVPETETAAMQRIRMMIQNKKKK